MTHDFCDAFCAPNLDNPDGLLVSLAGWMFSVGTTVGSP